MKITQKNRVWFLSTLLVICLIILTCTIYDKEKQLYRVKTVLLPNELARLAVEKYLLEDKIVVHGGLKDISSEKNGVFVTVINKKTGLRGCVGTVNPAAFFDDTGKEIVQVALLSATKDNRFLPVTKDELKDLVYTVDILEKPVTIKSNSELDPKNYGIIVSTGKKYGIILPDIAGVNDVKTQIQHAKNNGNIKENEKITEIQKFKVKRFK